MMTQKSGSSSNVLQGKTLLQNPFEFSDEQILDNVYRTHFHCVEKCDVKSLHTVASTVINHSIQITDTVIQQASQLSERFREETITSRQLTAKLKRIACQMVCTSRGEHYAHHTTMLILEQLKAYSWDAKALIVQAAFALEYGKFLYHPLTRQHEEYEKSLADLNGLLVIQQNIQHLSFFNSVVKKVMQVIECITEWKRLTSAGYDIKDVPTLADTLHEIPVVVYWAIFTFVTCTGQIDDFTTDHKVNKYELSKNFENKLDLILRTFREHLEMCSTEIGRIEDYSRRKNIIIINGKDIVKVLRALIISTENGHSRHNVINGLTLEQVKIEEFKKKHVLLFISGLEHIDEEIQLLKSVYEKLKEKPREVEGYRTEDFKILWIPIVDEWNEDRRKTLETKLQRTKFGWYVVKHFNFEIGIKLIKEVFNYSGKPVIPLMNPDGKVENFDTKQIISMYGFDGFPFRTSDHTRLTQQWNWFWSEMTKLNPRIGDLIEEDRYLFIYGGSDTMWIQEFTTAIEKLKRDVGTLSLQIDITVDSYQLGREDPKIVPRFWIGIDSLLASRKQQILKGGNEGVQDFATTEIKRLLFLKQDPKGWVILSKGYNVKLLGHGQAMSRTVKDLSFWHVKLHEEVSFDVAFKEYYESIKDKTSPRKCEHSEISNYPSDILAHIPCPNIECGRSMEVTSVNYRCCHGLDP
ncbi:protein SIEVE ELEMENT OCCLUSION B [Vigna radiata var. radiata]|uniref:Protein SIEVE ELEMENT OCCLUSION B n=1 Tax=Vigna radiata var. radiata TaxID=3916 RepID=A0A1S3VZ47_VIGRR|nr:protein SIEVE ELEMENT OCCLUSION B [Vigna radiata var. radiata]